MSTWTNQYLARLWDEADDRILERSECVFFRFALDIVQDQSSYTLPDYVRRVIRVTWKGRKLEPLTPQEANLIYPQSAYVDTINKYDQPSSVPRLYVLGEGDYRSFRLIPTPNESIAAATVVDINATDVDKGLIVTCYRNIDKTDPTLMLPRWIERRLKKAYAMMRAFSKEGIGQNIEAAKYFEQKYNYLLDQYRWINSGSFVAKRHTLNEGDLPAFTRRPPRPVLPPDFERL